MKKILMMLLFAGVTCSTSAFAKDVKCKVIKDDGEGGNYIGRCDFKLIRNDGSFTMTALNNKKMLMPLFKVRSVTVLIDNSDPRRESGFLFYNGNTKSAVSVYRNGACWGEMDNLNNVCAYAK